MRSDEAEGRETKMGRLWKALLFLVVLGAIAFVVFAYFGDLSPTQEQVSEPVELDVN